VDVRPTPEVGLNVSWGVTSNLTLDGTANPDFSQVEADVAQVTVNERFAIFYPEKRPFFLEGIELFNTPNSLIYTRRVVEPLGGLKLTGKVAGTNGPALGGGRQGRVRHGDDYPFVNALAFGAMSARSPRSAWRTRTGSRTAPTTG
jgi:hypothetical protein